MYEQNLLQIVEPIKKTTVSRLNKGKKWKYGYNKEHDLVVISKSGQIGDIVEIQNFQIALPKQTNVYASENKKWEQFEYPKDCLLYTSPSPRDRQKSRMPSSA